MSAPRLNFQEPIFDIAEVKRVDGSALRIVARQVKLTDTQRDYLDARRSEVRSRFQLPPVVGQLRLVLMGEIGDDGTRAAWELAFD